jgi:hypothetical protein
VVHFLLDGNKLTALLKEEESCADAEVLQKLRAAGAAQVDPRESKTWI